MSILEFEAAQQEADAWLDPTGRTFVMGDIHGGAKALAQVLERAEFDFRKDQLIQLGDVADGWAETYECVEILLRVKYLIALRGNHDQTFNQWLKTGSHPYNWDQGALETLKSYCRAVNFDLKYQRTVKRDFQNREVEYYLVNAIPEIIPQKHVDFFKKQVKYYMDGRNIFVHAGFDTRAPFVGQDESILYWDRSLWKTAMSAHAGGQKMKLIDTKAEEIFIGHTTTTGWDVDVPLKADIVWNMDTGAGFDGRLSMMEVNTKELYQSDNLLSLYPNDRGRYKSSFKKKVLPW